MLIDVQNLSALKRLRILALQSNRVTKIEGLEGLENLEELYLSHNGVKRLEGLEHNVRPISALIYHTQELPDRTLDVLVEAHHPRHRQQFHLRAREHLAPESIDGVVGETYTLTFISLRALSLNSYPDATLR